MAKEKESSSVVTPDLGYWEVRDLIQEAALNMDEEALRFIAMTYPEVFQNVMGQAKNSKKVQH